jgi:hypothetical protein
MVTAVTSAVAPFPVDHRNVARSRGVAGGVGGKNAMITRAGTVR